MAKLSAHGSEVSRFVRENPNPTYSDLVTWEKESVVVMSDGVVLTKRDVRFRPAGDWDTRNFHSYGWKKKGKLMDMTDETLNRIYGVWTKQGFVRE